MEGNYKKQIQYNKLVRDLIPEIIQSSGKACVTEVLFNEDYLRMVDAKLDEELAEYADFVLENGARRVAIEIDDETSHNKSLVASNKFYDDLLKQNSMVYLGWDVYRCAVRQMLVCARLRHVAGTQWGNKKYMNMKHLVAALEDASIAG